MQYIISIFITGFSLACLVYSLPISPEDLAPIVFIPGQGANLLDVKFNRSEPAAPGCPNVQDWKYIWMDFMDLFAGKHCSSYNFELIYDPITQTSRVPDDVEIRIPYFGLMKSVDLLDQNGIYSKGEYATKLIENLESLGYRTDIDLVAAPFDFRRGVFKQLTLEKDLKELIESTYTKNGNKKILFLCHSIGGLQAHRFLELQSRGWKKKYISSMLTIGTPWGGSIKPILYYLSGDDYNNPNFFNPNITRDLYRSFESSTDSFPNTNGFSIDQVFVETPSRNYSLKNIEQMFDDTNLPDGKQKYNKYLDDACLWRSFGCQVRHPGVKTYVLYSKGVPTIEKLIYDIDFPDFSTKPNILYGDGDGVVNWDALHPPSHWKWFQRMFGLTTITHTGINHSEMLGAQELMDLIENINNGIM